MRDQNIIDVRCTAAINLGLNDLTLIQGDLKELSESNFNKLKQSILRHGITFPFFVWQNDGKNYILDGTQRDRVLTRMAEEGFHIPALPCALIEAKDRKQPAEKILLISSQYGKMTNNSLDQFLTENDLNLLELNDELELPNIAGKQLGPWVTELRTACERARAELGDRELVIDLKDVTAISLEAENVLLQLMNERVKFRCGVFTKHALRQLARRKTNRKETEIEPARSSLRASTLS